MKAVLGSRILAQVLRDYPLTCFDIGARGGITGDLQPISSGVRAFGFEPDETECNRLNNEKETQSCRWRELRYVPTALGSQVSSQHLNLYRARGCTSILEADRTRAAWFSRADYYEPQGTVELTTLPLDSAIDTFNLPSPDFVKIDVQGYEMEVFNGGARALENVIGIRSEVSFMQMYEGQPLFSDITAKLKTFGLVPVSFEELHSWRRLTKSKHPRRTKGSVPFSRGQLVHCDVLYLREPELMADGNQEAVNKKLKLAIIAAAYGHIDLAFSSLNCEPVRKLFLSKWNADPTRMLGQVSRHFSRRHLINLVGPQRWRS